MKSTTSISCSAPCSICGTRSCCRRSAGPVARYVVTIHDATLHPGERFLPYQWWLDWEIQQADGYVVLSDHVGRVLRTRHQASMDRITVAPSGPFSQFADSRRACVEAADRRAPRRLLFFGRIVAYKGLDLLLDAYGQLKQTHPDLSLAIYGDGDLTPYRAAIDALADVTVENRYIPEDELPGILERSDLMVLPYREASQSGVMALAEAAGVPVVGTPTGALVEQIAPGVNGLIADAVDGKALAYSIGRFLDDPGLYQRCVLGISKHAEDRWSEAGERISQLSAGNGHVRSLGAQLLRRPIRWRGAGAPAAAPYGPVADPYAMPVSPKDTARDTARAVWRRIPSGLRRSLLFGTTRIAAPAARMPGPPPAEPIVIVGPISSATGLGEGARLAMRALRDQGLDVRGFDVSPVMLGGDPAEPIDPGLPVPPGPGTVILHVNAPLAPLALLMLGRPALRGKRIIGYFAWELPDLPDDWIAALDHVHEIWVPSRFTADAFRRHTNRPVHVVPHPVPVSGTEAEASAGRAARTALHRADAVQHGFRLHAEESGGGGARVQAGVRRWRRADARLILKTHHVSAYAAGCGELAAAIDGDPRITLLDRTMDRAELDELVSPTATRSCCCTGRKGSGCRWRKRWGGACRWWRPTGPAIPISWISAIPARFRTALCPRATRRAAMTMPTSFGPNRRRRTPP